MGDQQHTSSRSPQKRRVAVIGAGVSGLAAAKCLLDEELVPVVFEQAAEIGGVWKYQEALPAGGGVMYRSLRTNTSRQTFAFSDFPLSTALPDYPQRGDVLQYFCDYATHFGLRASIRLNTRVVAVDPAEDGQWRVRTRTGDTVATETFDAVVVSCGRENHPFLPVIPGAETFAGKILHSSAYKGPEDFAGSRVIVVGVGSSGADIATEVSTVAERVYLSIGKGAWFIPRYIQRRPYDHYLTRLAAALPEAVRRVAFRGRLVQAYRHAGVPLEQLRAKALPVPEFDLWRTRLTPVSGLLKKINDGILLVRPRIERIEGQEVIFSDGQRVCADVILCCTGYTLHLPFFPASLIAVQKNAIELYKQVFHPDLPNLAFVGLCVTAGAHPPVAEIQGRWVARVFAGHLKLPTSAEMTRAIEHYRSHPANRSPVPMFVPLIGYCDEIAGLLGVRPVIWHHPRELLRWFLGPFTAQHYRLDGPGKL